MKASWKLLRVSPAKVVLVACWTGEEREDIIVALLQKKKSKHLKNIAKIGEVFGYPPLCAKIFTIMLVSPVKVDHNSATGSTWHVLDLISLQSGLNVPDQGQEGDHHVESGPGHALQHRPATEVDAHMSLLNFVKGELYKLTFPI